MPSYSYITNGGDKTAYSCKKTVLFTDTDVNHPNEWVEVQESTDPLFENGGTPNVYSNVKGDPTTSDDTYYTQAILISPYEDDEKGGWASNEANLVSSLDSYATLNGETKLSSLEGCEVYAPSANQIAIKIKKSDVNSAMTNDGHCNIFIQSGAAIYDGYYLHNIKVNFNNSKSVFEVSGYKQEITLTFDKEYESEVFDDEIIGKDGKTYIFHHFDFAVICSDNTIPLDESAEITCTIYFVNNPTRRMTDKVGFTNDGLLRIQFGDNSSVPAGVMGFIIPKDTYLTYDNTHEQALITVEESCCGYYNPVEDFKSCTEDDYDAIKDFRDNALKLTTYTTNEGLCAGEDGYYQNAKKAFNELTDWQKDILLTSAVNADALARLQTWAIMNGETFDIENQQFIKNNSYKNHILLKTNSKGESTVVVIAFSISAISVLAYLTLSKKRKIH